MNNSIEIEEIPENEPESFKNRCHALVSDEILPKNGLERLAGVAVQMSGTLIPFIFPFILHKIFRHRSAYLAQEAAKAMEHDSEELQLYLWKVVIAVAIITAVITLLVHSF